MERSGVLGATLAARTDSLRRLLGSDWPDLVGQILAGLCCEDSTSERRAAAVRDALRSAATEADRRFKTLRSFVTDAYQVRLHTLVSELRFFAAVNAVMFALVGVLLYIRRSDMTQVLLPSAVLLCSTIVAAVLYVTTQDWFWSILLGDYMGAWYLVLLGAIGAFAADIAFLRGRVTAQILSALPNALVPPC